MPLSQISNIFDISNKSTNRKYGLYRIGKKASNLINGIQHWFIGKSNLNTPIVSIKTCKYLLENVMNYKVTNELGCGSFGSVYTVKMAGMEQSMACKVIRLGENWTHDSKLKSNLRSYEREAKLICNISHPNIVRYNCCFHLYCHKQNNNKIRNVIQVCNEPSRIPHQRYNNMLLAGFVIEKLDIGLREWMAKYEIAILNEDHIRNVFLQIGQALAYLHRTHHMTHGDLKSSNIMLVEDCGHPFIILPKLKLIDFSLATEHSSQDYLNAEVFNKTENKPNLFLMETYTFGDLLKKLATTKNVTNFKDSELIKILDKMAPPESQFGTSSVTVSWAVEGYTAKCCVPSIFGNGT